MSNLPGGLNDGVREGVKVPSRHRSCAFAGRCLNIERQDRKEHTLLVDNYGRDIRDLRISVTDRCNFKCFYCKSALALDRKERGEILSFEETLRVCRVFLGLGIEKIRITGGEPMVRHGVEDLVRQIGALPGLKDLALTTNGFNLFEKAEELRDAGLHRVTISLDTLKPERFLRMTSSKDFEKVLRSVTAARRCGLEPVKVNCVLLRGVNDDEIVDFAEFAREEGLTVRFVEFMPLDEAGQWSRDRVVTGAEVLRVLKDRYRMEPSRQLKPSDTSVEYRFSDAPGTIGLITPVSQPFCRRCSRIRLTADGKIRTCLFSLEEHDVKALMRSGADDRDLVRFIESAVAGKEPGDRINNPRFTPPSRRMPYIGG